MDKLSVYEVVGKLTGAIEPVGSTETDEIRFENLKEMCELAEMLMEDIAHVARQTNAYQGSIVKAAKYADDSLKHLDEFLKSLEEVEE